MKKIFVALVTLVAVCQAQAQQDSMRMKTGPLVIEAQDAEFLIAALTNRESYSDFFDGLIQKYNALGSPAPTAKITLDSVLTGTLLNLSISLRSLSYNFSKNIYSHLDAAIRACNNPFLLRQITILDKRDEEVFNALRKKGKGLFLREL